MEAVKWCTKAANKGYAEAECRMSVFCTEGRGGLRQSGVEAVKWCRKAAAQGLADAQLKMGALYLRGEGGVQQSDMKAIAWWKRAAIQGLVEVQSNLGWGWPTYMEVAACSSPMRRRRSGS